MMNKNVRNEPIWYKITTDRKYYMFYENKIYFSLIVFIILGCVCVVLIF